MQENSHERNLSLALSKKKKTIKKDRENFLLLKLSQREPSEKLFAELWFFFQLKWNTTYEQRHFQLFTAHPHKPINIAIGEANTVCVYV